MNAAQYDSEEDDLWEVEEANVKKEWARLFAEWTAENARLKKEAAANGEKFEPLEKPKRPTNPAVIFSDESKFNFIGSDGREWCWREPGKANDPRYTKKKIKHGGGSVMVWGCITSHGVGELHRIEGIMDRFVYVDILTKSLLGTLEKHNLDREAVYFQQDGDPKHRSAHARGFLELEGLDVLPWCPNSPDMSPIENVWNYLDRMVRSRYPLPKNLDELWLALKEEWENIPQEFINNLYRSMPNRVCDLLKAKGHHTRY
jgi:transposase